MTKLKLAVVGAGHLGRIHARLLAERGDVELVGVVDPVSSARESVATSFGTQAFADHREVLPRIDAAVIATPTAYHHRVAIDFLRAGKPLLIEKPLTENLAEADELVETAARHGAILQVGHIERFNPAFIAARARTGVPRYVEAVRASTFTGRSTDIGVVFDLMIHDIDLLLSMVDSPLSRVDALGLAVMGQREDVAQARLEFAGGTVANLSASRVSASAAPKRQMQIWSERGFVAIDFGSRSASVTTPNQAVAARAFDFNALPQDQKATFKDGLFKEVLRVEPLPTTETNALADEHEDFCEAIRARREPRVSGAAGRDAVAVAEAILDSIRAHQWHGHSAGPVGPLALPPATILRGPHWQPAAQPRPAA